MVTLKAQHIFELSLSCSLLSQFSCNQPLIYFIRSYVNMKSATGLFCAISDERRAEALSLVLEISLK